MLIKIDDDKDAYVDSESVQYTYLQDDELGFRMSLKSGQEVGRRFETKHATLKWFNALTSQIEKDTTTLKEKKSMKEQITDYFNKHRDFLFTVFAVILIDHFFLGGALRERIKSLADKLLDRAGEAIKDTNVKE